MPRKRKDPNCSCGMDDPRDCVCTRCEGCGKVAVAFDAEGLGACAECVPRDAQGNVMYEDEVDDA